MNLAAKLELSRANAAKWSAIAASPNMSVPATIAAQQLARSYRAAVILGEKAQSYENDVKRTMARFFGR